MASLELQITGFGLEIVVLERCFGPDFVTPERYFGSDFVAPERCFGTRISSSGPH